MKSLILTLIVLVFAIATHGQSLDQSTKTDELPNVFTPNGDRLNEWFEFPVEDERNIRSIKVYNRWGQLMHHSDENAIWNGRSFDGQLAPQGVYYYIIEEKEAEPFTGYITLLR
ncbi:MAG: gliding motility-associated C-terminal domain-containing protein [Flavobacteriales bacterium]|nr:gliding motility-associated C-terminal domain-containing protein [Flavobacteriales bacterium]